MQTTVAIFAAIDRVTLCYDDRATIRGFRAGGFFEIGPPDFGLLNYHSTSIRGEASGPALAGRL
jgi:hypothetical protein